MPRSTSFSLQALESREDALAVVGLAHWLSNASVNGFTRSFNKSAMKGLLVMDLYEVAKSTQLKLKHPPLIATAVPTTKFT